MLDIATTPSRSADLHTFRGSSAAGAVPPLVPLGVAAEPAVSSGSHRGSPDAEVIDLAERVTRLAERHAAGRPEVERIKARVRAENPSPPTYAPSEVWDPFILRLRAAEEASGLNRLWKVRSRMLRRLSRWTDALIVMAPSTMPGLSAKAAASLALRDRDKTDMRYDRLAQAVQNDLIRLAAARPAVSSYDPDAELKALVAEWEPRDVECDAAGWVRDDAVDRFNAIRSDPPEVLFAKAGDVGFIAQFAAPHFQGDRPWYGAPWIMERVCKHLKSRELNASELERSRELLESFKTWQADGEEAKRKAGLDKAEEAWWSSINETAALRQRIFSMPAHTMDGVLTKARVVLSCYGGDGLREELEGELKAGNDGATAEIGILYLLMDIDQVLSPTRGAADAGTLDAASAA